jgi:hypothetical protein
MILITGKNGPVLETVKASILQLQWDHFFQFYVDCRSSIVENIWSSDGSQQTNLNLWCFGFNIAHERAWSGGSASTVKRPHLILVTVLSSARAHRGRVPSKIPTISTVTPLLTPPAHPLPYYQLLTHSTAQPSFVPLRVRPSNFKKVRRPLALDVPPTTRIINRLTLIRRVCISGWLLLLLLPLWRW